MTIVFKVSDNVKDKMIAFYANLKKDKTPDYAIFQAVDADTVITLYESGKAMFQGVSADIDANIWIDMEKHLNNRDIEIKDPEKNEVEKDTRFLNISSLGSDEVGTGDFFGPIVVSAAYVDKININFMNNLGVRDSKKIDDEKILKIAPEIIKKIPYVSYVLNNEVYNRNYNANTNMNKIKAILHNKVLTSLIKKDHYSYEKIIIDQFVYPQKYFEHIKDVPEKVTNITFLTHAEDKCLSVAAASIISRYIFLKEMDKLSNELKMTIPKGAGPKVDEVAQEIVNKYGFDKLSTIAKLNFKNIEKIKKANS